MEHWTANIGRDEELENLRDTYMINCFESLDG